TRNDGATTMGYYIYAWLEHGDPRLRVVDARTGSICLHWDYHDAGRSNASDKKEIQRLFRDLLLLTCRQESQNIRLFNIHPIPTGGRRKRTKHEHLGQFRASMLCEACTALVDAVPFGTQTNV
ncbi:MAG: hypothetical protein L0Y43_07065, partial [Methylococcaceae bacterium]|nr:hypothetical protein [Methylococcaceae bacterium]